MAALRLVVELTWATASQARGAETWTGDVGLAMPRRDGTLLVVVDGVGHGQPAAAAARCAIEALEGIDGNDLPAAISHCHEALKTTRGAAMGLVWVDRWASSMSWLGIGNVSGVLHRADRRSAEGARVMPQGVGMVGRRLPALHPSTAAVGPGDMIVLATDGVKRDFMDALPSPFWSEGEIAERLVAAHADGRDDAFVLVARIPVEQC